jgi:hypothetical protein
MAKKSKETPPSEVLIKKFIDNEIDLETLLSNDDIYNRILEHINEFLKRGKNEQIESLEDTMNIIKQKFITSTKTIQDSIIEAVKIGLSYTDPRNLGIPELKPNDLNSFLRYCKYNLIYQPNYGDQIIKLPQRLLEDKTGDCKSFAVLMAVYCIYYKIPNGLIFASYDENHEITHVYNYIIQNGKLMEIDLTISDPKQTEKKWYKKEYYEIY